MTNEYDKYSEEQLAKVLNDQYGFQVDSQIPRQTLIDQIEKCKADNKKSAVDDTKKACEVYRKILDHNKVSDEPFVDIRFEHKDGDKEIEFRYAGGLTMPTTGSGKNKKWAMLPPKWHFISGHQYNVPFKVLEHLNSLVVADAITVTDPVTGQDITKPHFRRRMAAEIVLSREQAGKIKGTKDVKQTA